MARSRPEGQLLQVRVHPGARRSAIEGWHGPALRVSVTASPSEGRANRAVAELLAAACGVAPSSVELVTGASSRDKRFRVGSLSLGELRARLVRARA